MSDAHSESFIKTPTQLVMIIVLAFVVPIAIIYLIIQMVMGTGSRDGHPAMSDKAVTERIQPVAGVPAAAIEKGPSPLLAAPAPAAAPVVVAAPSSVAAAPSADVAKGKTVYASSCVACHAAGVAGAPKLGDAAAWTPRINAGTDALYASALKGKNAMPPKGGNPALTDADIKAAVDYMVSQSK
jgi:cytochrome c5